MIKDEMTRETEQTAKTTKFWDLSSDRRRQISFENDNEEEKSKVPRWKESMLQTLN